MRVQVVDLAEVVVEVIEDSQGFAALEEEWEDLHRQCPRLTPLQSWASLYSWWENYTERYELRIVAVWDDDLLVGIMLLILDHQRDLDKLLFVSTGLTDNPDLLTIVGREDKVREAAVQVCRQMRSCR
jgi:hypothetical protein